MDRPSAAAAGFISLSGNCKNIKADRVYTSRGACYFKSKGFSVMFKCNTYLSRMYVMGDGEKEGCLVEFRRVNISTFLPALFL